MTEQSLPYDSPQVIFPEGTEQYVDDRTVPLVVGHITTYHTDMRNKLESLPDSTLEHWEVGSADQLTTKLGDTDQIPYLYRQSGGDLIVGTREYDTLVGGTVAWNQMTSSYTSSGTVSGITFVNDDGKNISATGTVSGDGFEYDQLRLTASMGEIKRDGTKYAIVLSAPFSTNGGIAGYSPCILAGTYGGIFSNTQGGTWSCRVYQVAPVGTVININKLVVNVYNITQMLGTTIADYVYSLETATAGSGVAWLKKYGFIDDTYHPYNAGSLLSVHPSAHKMIGFNQWDEEWEIGGISSSTGENVIQNQTIRSTNYIRIIPNEEYYIHGLSISANFRARFYDADKKYIGYSPSGTEFCYWNRVFVALLNAYYMRFEVQQEYGTTYKHDICINLSKTTGSPKNGDYVPYSANIYALPDADLRGIFKLDSNNKPYADGDTDDGSGTRTRKYGIVDLGTLDWNYNTYLGSNTFWSVGAPAGIIKVGWQDNQNIFCAKYVTNKAIFTSSTEDKIIGRASNGQLYLHDYAYTDTATFKTAMSGVYLVYELATPTTEDSTPFQNPQIVDPDGTEEYIDTRDVSVPVGHSTFYPKDLKRKLEELPDPPSGANGTYILKATINNGVTTYSWVVE